MKVLLVSVCSLIALLVLLRYFAPQDNTPNLFVIIEDDADVAGVQIDACNSSVSLPRGFKEVKYAVFGCTEKAVRVTASYNDGEKLTKEGGWYIPGTKPIKYTIEISNRTFTTSLEDWNP